MALFIMAIVLVTQFNSFYSAFLILSAVVMSTIGVLIGLLITGKALWGCYDRSGRNSVSRYCG